MPFRASTLNAAPCSTLPALAVSCWLSAVTLQRSDLGGETARNTQRPKTNCQQLIANRQR